MLLAVQVSSSLQKGKGRSSQPRGHFLFPQDPQSSPGMTSNDGSRHRHDSFFLPGLITQGMRAVLPSGSRTFPGRLGSPPRAARLFLPASEEGKRATLPSGIRDAVSRLRHPLRVARNLSASVWLSLRNLSLSAVVSQALGTNTAAGRAFFILSSQPVAAREALP